MEQPDFPTLRCNRKILDLCGGTGSWSRPYREAGYDVRVITLPEDDVRLFAPPANVWGILAAPPCTEFSKSKEFQGRGKYEHDFRAGLEIVSACLRIITTSAPKFWALENPRGYLRRWLGEPAFSFQPWEYGDKYQKLTELWGTFAPPTPTETDKPDNLIKFSLLKSREIHPEYYGILDRSSRRAITPTGFADAFFRANP